jgi:hypothetical protein
MEGRESNGNKVLSTQQLFPDALHHHEQVMRLMQQEKFQPLHQCHFTEAWMYSSP